MAKQQFQNFEEFWPFYLGEHSDIRNRRLHFFGTSLSLLIAVVSVALEMWWGLLGAVFCGYFFAWLGHFGLEKNRPATFQHPLYSLRGDFRMWWLILTGRLRGD